MIFRIFFFRQSQFAAIHFWNTFYNSQNQTAKKTSFPIPTICHVSTCCDKWMDRFFTRNLLRWGFCSCFFKQKQGRRRLKHIPSTSSRVKTEKARNEREYNQHWKKALVKLKRTAVISKNVYSIIHFETLNNNFLWFQKWRSSSIFTEMTCILVHNPYLGVTRARSQATQSYVCQLSQCRLWSTVEIKKKEFRT